MPSNSTNTFTVRTATIGDVSKIAESLIPEGIDEFKRAGSHPVLSMAYGMKTTDAKVIISPDGIPCAIFGVREDGFGWMNMTMEIRRHKVSFVRFFRKYIAELGPFLWSTVDISNTTLHKFLKLLGYRALRVFVGNTRNIYYVEFVKVNYG